MSILATYKDRRYRLSLSNPLVIRVSTLESAENCALAARTPHQSLPFIFASRERISWRRRIGNGFEVWSSSSTRIAFDPVSERLQVGVPVTAHGISAEPNRVVDVDPATGTGDAQVRLMLDEIVEALEPGIGRHVTEAAAADCDQPAPAGSAVRRWSGPTPWPLDCGYALRER